MRRSSHAGHFTNIRVEGALLPPDLLLRVAESDAALGGLSSDDYHQPPRTRLNEAVNRSWNRLTGAWSAFRKMAQALPASDLKTSQTRERWLLPLFQELGFGRLATSSGLVVGEHTYAISHSWGAVPIHLVGCGLDLDTRVAGVAGAARLSPHGLLQDLLNRSDAHLWGFVSNGLKLRVLRDNASLVRQAFLEFDLEAILEGQDYAGFALLWLVCHQSRVEGERPEECWLERWSRAAQEEGTRALDRLREGVTQSIEALGCGFLAHPGNRGLREKLHAGELHRQDYYRQLLRLVYRLIFLFVAEDRDLLLDPEADEAAKVRYRQHYATRRIRDLAGRRRGSRHADLFHPLRLVMRGLGSDEGCPALGLPPLGGFLFSPQAAPDLEACEIANRDLLTAIRALAYSVANGVLRPVDYRNLGSEELGSVYESLLELHPEEMNLDAARFALVAAAGSERKTTGSYYTPRSLVQCLLDSALEPVLDDVSAGKHPLTAGKRSLTGNDVAAALLKLKVCDPACGSGHFLVAAAHRIARRVAAARTGEDEPSPEAYRRALRDAIGHCVYGVDLNPLSVELCKVSLWMEALEPGRPLSFLNHHIKCGNSLLGVPLPSQVEAVSVERERRRRELEREIEDLRVPAASNATLNRERRALQAELKELLLPGWPDSIPDAAFAVLEGDDPAFCRSLRLQNATERTQLSLFPPGEVLWQEVKELAVEATRIEVQDDGTVDGIHEQERLHHDLVESERYHGARFYREAWCTAFVWQKAAGAPPAMTHQTLQVIRREGPRCVQEVMRAEVERLAQQHRFFLWEVEFSEVFASDHGRNGGFDVVLGNPPWDMQEVRDNEFFAVSYPAILGVASAKDKERVLQQIQAEDPVLWTNYQNYVREVYAERLFIMESGRFPLSAVGRLNLYRLFLETGQSILADTGTLGMVIPSGFASDTFCQEHFTSLHGKGRIAAFYDFENREGLFPEVHRSQKFALLTVTGAKRTIGETDFVFYAARPEELRDQTRHVPMSQDDLRAINPLSLTAPLFRSERDRQITLRLHKRAPILVDDSEDGWQIEPKLMFMMNASMKAHRTSEELEKAALRLSGNRYVNESRRWLPFYEGKMVGAYDHRAASVSFNAANRVRRNQPVETTLNQHQDPDHAALPMFWVEDTVVADRWGMVSDWCLVVKDVTGATNERTVIGAVVPKVALTHSVPWLRCQREARLQACLLANINAFVLDYVSRQKIAGLHLYGHYLTQLPMLSPADYMGSCALAVTGWASWIWPRVVELSYTAWDIQPFAQDCGYDGHPFRWDEERRFLICCELDAAYFHLYGIVREDVEYIMDTFPIVKRKDEALHNGEYRTKRVILEVYDAMAEAMRTGRPYQTLLDPPPADPRVAHTARGDQ